MLVVNVLLSYSMDLSAARLSAATLPSVCLHFDLELKFFIFYLKWKIKILLINLGP